MAHMPIKRRVLINMFWETPCEIRSAVASKQQLLAVVVVVHGQQSLPPELLHLMESSEYFKIC